MQRAVKFARYLPDFGWESVVITGPIGSIGDSNLQDQTLSDELPSGLEVRRLPGREPHSRGGWRGRVERWLRVPTPWSRWWIEGTVASGRHVSSVDVVLATMSPFDSCIAAQRLARHHGVPWVADLRDPWALDEMRVYASRVHRRLELRRMRRSLRSASGIVMNTPEAASALIRAFPEMSRSQVFVIPNGFDATDFEGPEPARSEATFRIVHTGDLHTAFGLRHREAGLLRRLLGGALGDVDILPRSHVFLLESLQRLLDRRPELRGVIEVHLAGGMDETDHSAVDSDAITPHGYVTHGGAIRLMRSADLLFLPMHDVRPPRRARIVPGKTYEYLASGSPILAAVPDGDARDLLAEAGNTRLVRPSDVAAMERELEAAVDQKLAGDEPPSPSAMTLARYERRALAQQLAQALETVSARS